VGREEQISAFEQERAGREVGIEWLGHGVAPGRMRSSGRSGSARWRRA
jgi:hypothetical protein